MTDKRPADTLYGGTTEPPGRKLVVDEKGWVQLPGGGWTKANPTFANYSGLRLKGSAVPSDRAADVLYPSSKK